jgi:hypothetical protein
VRRREPVGRAAAAVPEWVRELRPRDVAAWCGPGDPDPVARHVRARRRWRAAAAAWWREHGPDDPTRPEWADRADQDVHALDSHECPEKKRNGRIGLPQEDCASSVTPRWAIVQSGRVRSTAPWRRTSWSM